MSIIAVTTALVTLAASNGTLYSSGAGSAAGSPHQSAYQRLRVVEGAGKVTQASAGTYFALALRGDGTVVAWGNNDYRQLGQGKSKVALGTPAVVNGLPPISMVAAGSSHSIARARNGTVYGWGRARDGQLGPSYPENLVGTPIQIAGLGVVAEVAVGNGYTLARKANGTVWAFGSNAFGQLGLGNTTDTSTPTKIPGLTNVVAIAAGYWRSYAIKSDGSVVAWGINSNGHLGTGSVASSVLSPEVVPGLEFIKKISVSDTHQLALRDDGMVMSWGRNDTGELGNPSLPQTYAGTTTPTLVPNLSNIVDIASGTERSIAIDENGSAWAAGVVEGYHIGDYSSSSFLKSEFIVDATSCWGGTYNTYVLSRIQRPIWAMTTPSSVVSNDETAILRIVNEKPATTKVPISISSTDPNLSVPAEATIPANASYVDVPVKAINKVWSYTTVPITVSAGPLPMETSLEVMPENSQIFFPTDGAFAGDTFKVRLRINFDAPNAGAKFTLTSPETTQLTFPANVTIPAGQREVVFNVESQTSKDGYLIQLKAKRGENVSQTVQWLNGNMLAKAEFTQQYVLGGGNVDLRLTLAEPAPSGGFTIQLLQGGTYFTMPEEVYFAAGEQVRTVPIGTQPVAAPSNLPLTLGVPGYYARVAWLNVVPPTLTSIVATPNELAGGGTVHFRIDLDGPSLGDVVILATGKAEFHLPANVTIPVGQSFVEFDVPTDAVTESVTGFIRARLRGVTVQAKVKLTP